MSDTQLHKQLFEAGVHFGHLKKKWNPKMLPYIYAERKGIHIIDLNKTATQLEQVSNVLKTIARNGKSIMFVATKKNAKQIVRDCALTIDMPFVTERWLGGMLTNFSTIRKSIKKMNSIDKLLNDDSVDTITKKEKLQLKRDRDKLEKILGGISKMNRLPVAIFLVDIGHENIALLEAKKLGIATFGMVDTNCDPNKVDYVIPANDDSTKSINVIVEYVTKAIAEGISERKIDKSNEEQNEDSNVIIDETNSEIRIQLDDENVDAKIKGLKKKEDTPIKPIKKTFQKK